MRFPTKWTKRRCNKAFVDGILCHLFVSYIRETLRDRLEFVLAAPQLFLSVLNRNCYHIYIDAVLIAA